jgi:MFS family permease
VRRAGARAREWVSAGPWLALRHRDYRLLWSGQLASVTGSEMRQVAVAWQVYLISHSALQLGILGLSQAIALTGFSLVGGVVADASDRRRLLVVVQSVLACGSLVLAVTTLARVASLPLIYVVVFLMAAASAFDFPARQALVPTLVPREELPDALSLNSLLFNLATIVGPSLGGFAIVVVGVGGIYVADVVSYVAVTAALLALRRGGSPAGERPRVGMATLLEGFSYLQAHRYLLGLMVLDFCAMFFGSPEGLLPVYARDILRVGPQGLGALLSAGAGGAVLGVGFSGRLRGVRRQGLGVLVAVAAWGTCIVLFGLTNGPLWHGAAWRVAWKGPFWLAFVLLAGAGAADLVSTILRNTIMQLSTPDRMRGRVAAANGMFVIGGPALGQFESGLVASLLTPQLSVLTGGLACLAAAGLIALGVPGVRRYDARAHGTGARRLDDEEPPGVAGLAENGVVAAE